MQHERVLVLDFGGQYNQLIARRVREQGVYCDLLPCDMSIEKIKEYAPIGIIFTGGPNSVYEAGAPHIDARIFDLGIPVLGICYGCQLIAYTLGGEVAHADTREYGKSNIIYAGSALFAGMRRRPAPRRPLKTPPAISTASSSMPKCTTPPRAKRSCTTSCTACAGRKGTGR